MFKAFFLIYVTLGAGALVIWRYNGWPRYVILAVILAVYSAVWHTYFKGLV